MKRTVLNSILAGLTVGLIAVILCFMTGCKTLRKQRASTQAETAMWAKFDSLEKEAAEAYARAEAIKATSSEKSEDLEGHKADTATLELSATDLKPVTDADGETQGRLYVAESGNVTATVKVGKNGKVRIECKSDSLLRVIRRYWRDSSYQSFRFDSLAANKTVQTTEQQTKVETTLVQEHEKVNRGFFGWLADWLLKMAIGALVWEILKKLYSIYTLRR